MDLCWNASTVKREFWKTFWKNENKSHRRTLVKENRYRRRHSWLVSLKKRFNVFQNVDLRPENLQQQPVELGGTCDATRRHTMYLVRNAKQKKRKTWPKKIANNNTIWHTWSACVCLCVFSRTQHSEPKDGTWKGEEDHVTLGTPYVTPPNSLLLYFISFGCPLFSWTSPLVSRVKLPCSTCIVTRG